VSERHYLAAWDEWADLDGQEWDPTVGDGIDPIS
jgi:hypothetical protein